MRTRCSRGLLLVMAFGVAACGAPPRLPEGWDRAAARAFQTDEDASMAAPVSPRTAVQAFYFGGTEPNPPRGALELAVVGEGPRATVTSTPPEPTLVFELDGDGVRCQGRCPSARLPATAEVSLPPFVLAVGRQAGAGARVVVHDPARAAPVPATRWFPVDPRFIVAARFVADPAGETVALTTTRGLHKPFVRVGALTFEIPTEQGLRPGQLSAFASRDAPDGPWLVPFSDPTNGRSTYPVGRYLSVDPPRDGGDAVALDFNRATQPWCAYAEHYNCPVPPASNRLGFAIEAGERDWAGH